MDCDGSCPPVLAPSSLPRRWRSVSAISRLLHRQQQEATPVATTTDRSGAAARLPHIDPRGWPVKATIVAVAVAAYTLVGYDYRPIVLPAVLVPPRHVCRIRGPARSIPGRYPSPSARHEHRSRRRPGATSISRAAARGDQAATGKDQPDNMIDTAFADCSDYATPSPTKSRWATPAILMTPKSDATRRIDRRDRGDGRRDAGRQRRSQRG